MPWTAAFFRPVGVKFPGNNLLWQLTVNVVILLLLITAMPMSYCTTLLLGSKRIQNHQTTYRLPVSFDNYEAFTTRSYQVYSWWSSQNFFPFPPVFPQCSPMFNYFAPCSESFHASYMNLAGLIRFCCGISVVYLLLQILI